MASFPNGLTVRLREFFNPREERARLPRRLFWVALLARVLYMTLAHTYRIRPIIDHFQFGWEMGRIARSLVLGRGYSDPFNGRSGPTAWTPPLYPLLLAGVFRVFGIYSALSAWVILTINCVFSAATAPAVYQIGWRCFGIDRKGLKVARWSGWLWALYPAAMQYAVHWVWDMALTAMLFSWVVVLALWIRGLGEAERAGPRKSRQLWLAFGSLWGLIALSNSSLLILLPAFGLWMVWGLWKHLPSLPVVVLNAALSGLCCLLVISPWMIRNSLVFHAFVPLRANFGAELYESVQPENHGFPWMATLPMAEADPTFQRYKRMGELAYSKQQGERARPIIRAHRGLFFAHALERVYFFWVSVPHPVDRSVTVEVVREVNFAFVSVGAWLGLALALRKRLPGAWLFLLALLIQPVIYYFITVQARFRHPLEPIMTVLIVYLFQSATPRVRTKIEA